MSTVTCLSMVSSFGTNSYKEIRTMGCQKTKTDSLEMYLSKSSSRSKIRFCNLPFSHFKTWEKERSNYVQQAGQITFIIFLGSLQSKFKNL